MRAEPRSLWPRHPQLAIPRAALAMRAPADPSPPGPPSSLYNQDEELVPHADPQKRGLSARPTIAKLPDAETAAILGRDR